MNAAAADRPGWFPDLTGRTAILLGAGPSLTPEQVRQCRGRGYVIAINRSHELAPWADALYGCDGKFWNEYPAARAFAGLKISQDGAAVAKWPEIKRVSLLEGVNVPIHIPAQAGVICGGGNGGFQAFSLAIQAGAGRVVLLGFDMRASEQGGAHWHPDHPRPLANPGENNFDHWRDAFRAVAPAVAAAGVQVVNATPGSALGCFPLIDVGEAIL